MINNPMVSCAESAETTTGVIPGASAWTRYSFHYLSSDFSQKSITPSSQTTINDIVKGSIFYISSASSPTIETMEIIGLVEEITDGTAYIASGFGRFFFCNGDFTMNLN